jgi:ABC-type antimicrobial peptide transport system permease subunit
VLDFHFQVDPEVFPQFRMNEIVAAATSRERFLAMLLIGAATVSLLLGAVGIYGIAAYTVRRRTSEIGVRVALGARPVDVTWMVLRQTLLVVVLGAAAGLALALAATRVLRTVLYQVSPTDPAVLLGVTGLIIGVAAAASLGPALRAARANPTSALREE